jgi:BMFP domain-containing protein YqiC
MKNFSFISDLVKSLTSALPEHLDTFKSDFGKNCEAILQRSFDKLDLVTREEFDAQTKVLARTREKLEALQEQLTQLQQKK